MSGRRLYTQIAGLYDQLSRRTPGLYGLRRRAVSLLDLQPGDTVVDLGCGTGPNLPLLADAVGPSGTVVGIDYTRSMLDRARQTTISLPAVQLCHADARTPPIDGPIDGVLGTFVAGMFDDPVGVFEHWGKHLGPDGQCVLVSMTASDRRWAAPLNAAYRLLVVLSTPPLFRVCHPTDPVATHDCRIRDAHDWLATAGPTPVDRRHAGGLVRMTANQLSIVN